MRWARFIGLAVQAIVLGVLLFFAVLRLLAPPGSTRMFHYQGF